MTKTNSMRIGDTSPRGWLPVLLGAALLSLPAGLPAQVTLTTVVDLAERNSVDVRMAQADVRKAAAQLSESKDVIIPSVLFNTGLPVFPQIGFTGSPPSIWGATVQSLVFSVPQKRYIDAANLGLKAATAHLRDTLEQVALDASTSYIELDTVNRELAAAREQEEFARRLVAIEQSRTEAGVDPENDLLDARLAAAEIRLRRLHLETRAATLVQQLSELTEMPLSTIVPQHGSIPEIPQVRAESGALTRGIEAAQYTARSREVQAKGDRETNYFPQLSFAIQYLRNTTLLNNVNHYFLNPLPADNLSSGISIQVPLFDMVHRAKARESAADALRARVEAEQAERQNEVQIAQISSSLRELDAQAEIADLKQQIAANQLRTVLTQLEAGSGGAAATGAAPQLTPRAEQQARIEASQRLEESLDAGFDLAKARLGLMRALGHMGDWLRELNVPTTTP